MNEFYGTAEDLTTAILKFGSPSSMYYMGCTVVDDDPNGTLLLHLCLDSQLDEEDIGAYLSLEIVGRLDCFFYYDECLYYSYCLKGDYTTARFIKIHGMNAYEFDRIVEQIRAVI